MGGGAAKGKVSSPFRRISRSAFGAQGKCEATRGGAAYPSPDVRSQRRQGELVQHAQRNENHLRVAEHRVNAETGRLARSRHEAQAERRVGRPPSARPCTLTEHVNALAGPAWSRRWGGEGWGGSLSGELEKCCGAHVGGGCSSWQREALVTTIV